MLPKTLPRLPLPPPPPTRPVPPVIAPARRPLSPPPRPCPDHRSPLPARSSHPPPPSPPFPPPANTPPQSKSSPIIPPLTPVSLPFSLLHCSAFHSPLFIDTAGATLKDWVVENGGTVHPSLVVAINAPSGSRGVVAEEAIPYKDEPLVSIPERLYLSNIELGSDRYRKLLKKSKAVVDTLPAYMQLALVLCIEAEAGEKSFWYPYIQCLDQQNVPNGWAMSKEEAEGVLTKLGVTRAVPEWETKLVEASEAIEAQVGR